MNIDKKIVFGIIPVLKGDAYLGNQIIHYDCKDNPTCDP